MEHLKVGHATDADKGTGLTVFLFDPPARGVFAICGSAPASHELHTLALDAAVAEVNGLMLTGGSAFGLNAVEGVMRWLVEHERGFKAHHGVVPIVPAAAIYDLAVKQASPPTAAMAYAACLAASENNPLQGAIGAGTGASVGKLLANTKRMTGGLGFAEQALANGVKVMAYAVVNCVGDVFDTEDRIIAGALLPDGTFANSTQSLLAGNAEPWTPDPNTTLIALFTNARFSKAALQRITKMAIAGIARAISPALTPYDGDIVFSFSLGEHLASESMVGAIAACTVRQAIINAVQQAKPL